MDRAELAVLDAPPRPGSCAAGCRDAVPLTTVGRADTTKVPPRPTMCRRCDVPPGHAVRPRRQGVTTTWVKPVEAAR